MVDGSIFTLNFITAFVIGLETCGIFINLLILQIYEANLVLNALAYLLNEQGLFSEIQLVLYLNVCSGPRLYLTEKLIYFELFAIPLFFKTN